ncbi:MAG: DUF6151 family protein [Boseongicola sp.]
MSDEIEWTCRCGAFRARIDLRLSGRVVCYCKFCQAFANQTGAADQLDGAGGTDLIQTVPERLKVLTGFGHLRCLRLSRKGPLRWYVTCCGAPLGSTFSRRFLPYLTITVAGLVNQEELSPVHVRANLATARAPIKNQNQRWSAFLYMFGRRTIGSWLSGGFRETPFFDRDGKLVAEIERLTPGQKIAAFASTKGS